MRFRFPRTALSHGIHPVTFIIAALLVSVCFTLVQSRMDFLCNTDLDFLLHLRGTRQLSSNILLVAIDESDIKTLGGWPITRDYYGYLIHILTEKRAKVIGLDVLLNTSNRQYPENDRMLAEFIQTSKRVVLPNILETVRTSGPLITIDPLPEFAQGSVGVGFSNLGDESTIRRVPLLLESKDSLHTSFGLTMAQVWLNARIRREGRTVVLAAADRHEIRVPIDKQGRMLINPAGGISSIRSMRLTSLFHEYETVPDSLDFTNKLVLIAATAPSLPVLKSTPLCSQLPASLIHITVTENILNKKWLRYPPLSSVCFWILIWMGVAYPLSRVLRFRNWIFWILVGTVAAVVLSLCLLLLAYEVMPLFLSIFLFLGTALILRRLKNRRQREKDVQWTAAIEAQILVKEKALAEAEHKLAEIEKQLATEIEEKKELSEKGRKLAEEKENAVLELEKQVLDLKSSVGTESEPLSIRFKEIVHAPKSPMNEVLAMAEKAASDDIPVLIQGETGTGKELIARVIHQASPRQHKPFIAVNCGALSESLLESELFGHEKGAFTGAHNQRRGRFELAKGGTLFLDEIAETTPAFQARLLRVLQEGVFERVGGERTLTADVRIIAAHNKDMAQEVRDKRFREDLYFRLKGFPINLPALRKRPEDIPLLVGFFLQKYSRGLKIRVSDSTLLKLRSYRWPGNVRELENAIRRAILLSRSDGRKMIQLKDLPEEIQKTAEGIEPVLYHPIETQILETLRAFQFSHSAIGETARALGNRDRGTVTEYFRGLCFQFLAQQHGDFRKAASELAGSKESEVVARVESKIRDYVKNVRVSLAEKPFLDYTQPSCFKGLPQKFHPFLQRLIDTVI
jgi:transcriptional regulator with GAF, ATPase, and Fis domain/CHASE2 domain-containing sensor protein